MALNYINTHTRLCIKTAICALISQLQKALNSLQALLNNSFNFFKRLCFFQTGGMKAGCFDNYPSHSNDPYVVKKSKGGDGTEKRIFRPSQGSKSTPTRSIINQNVERRINNLNFRQPITVSI